MLFVNYSKMKDCLIKQIKQEHPSKQWWPAISLPLLWHPDWIKTHSSPLQDQEEIGHMSQMSELFTRNITQNFAGAVNKPPRKLSL